MVNFSFLTVNVFSNLIARPRLSGRLLDHNIKSSIEAWRSTDHDVFSMVVIVIIDSIHINCSKAAAVNVDNGSSKRDGVTTSKA